MSEPQLPFTGERFTPECVREIWYEHMHRYAFAVPLSRGARVLDAACGEGYGSALLAGAADNVLGADISPEAIGHARTRYGQVPNLSFLQADCTALDELPSASVDLIVSFETLEHVEEQERMLDGFARLLTEDGLLLVSTPDKHTYTDLTGQTNEFHVRELYRHQFEELLAPRFPAVRLFGQKLLFQSALWDVTKGAVPNEFAAAMQRSDGGLDERLNYPPLYYIAVCARNPDALAALPGLHLFGDSSESVYSHYNEEVRRHIAAGLMLRERDAEIERLRARVAELEAAAR